MRRPRVQFTVRRTAVALGAAAVLLAVVIGPLARRRGDVTARPAQAEARGRLDGRDVEAAALGERRAVEVEGQPLIVDGYAASPALGDIDGDGRPDLLLGGPDGFLKVYRNVGGPDRLRLAAPVAFGDFCDDERIPTG